MQHYTRLDPKCVTAKIPNGFEFMISRAKQHDFSNGRGMEHGDAICWQVGKDIYAYVVGARFGFVASKDSIAAMQPVHAATYMTRDIPALARCSTPSEIDLINVAIKHPVFETNAIRSGNMYILPLAHNMFTYVDKSAISFGFFFKPLETASPSR